MANLNKFINGEVVGTQTGSIISSSQGTMLHRKLTSNTTFSIDLQEGESITFFLDRNGRSVNWPTMNWVGGSAPTLDPTGYSVIILWKMLGTVCGAYNGKIGDL